MRGLASYLRSHKHPANTATRNPLFGFADEPGADAAAAASIRNHETPDFAVGIRLKVMNDGNIDPPDNGTGEARDIHDVIC